MTDTSKIKPIDWFDEKYHDGKKPTLEDRAALCKQCLELPFTDRGTKTIDRQIKEALHKFEHSHEYKPSLHIMAYTLVFCIAPLSPIDEQSIKKYISLYKDAIKKHERNIPLDSNFKHEEQS